MKFLRVLFFVVLVSFACPLSIQASTLYLSITASMTDAFKEIVNIFRTNHSDTRVLMNFGSSGSLAKQILQGAPADFYVSANPKWLAYLIEKEIIAEKNSKIIAYNKMVFVGHPEITFSGMRQLTTLKKISIGSPQSVPAGQYAKQAMEKAGVYSLLQNEKKLVIAKDVRQALLYADRGEVDGAFVYKTDVQLARNIKILFSVPEELYDRVSYPLALTVRGAEKKEAIAFFDFMASKQAVAILRKYGFETPVKILE